MDEVDDILDEGPIVEEEEEEEEDDEMDVDDNGQHGQDNDEDGVEGDDGDEDEDDNEEDEEDDNEEDEEDEEDEEEREQTDNNDDLKGQQDSTAKTQDDQEANRENTTDTENKDSPAPLNKLHHYYLSMLQAAKIASSYNIYPTAAIPIQAHVNALTMSKGLKYLFIGGSDGYIRKYDFLNTLQGKLSLTIIQKHSLTESITNAGILTGYWENEIPQYKKDVTPLGANKADYQPKVSPVYSLAVEDECLFMLSGLQNGGITMQGVRYMEGAITHYFKEHSNVVNLLKFNGTQDKFLSGAWDKRILEWDLVGGGRVCNEFRGNNSEVSSMEYRPLFCSVEVKDIIKNTSRADGSGSDDEMGSLFGDDEDEEEEKMEGIETKEKEMEDSHSNSIKTTKNPAEEISSRTLRMVYDEDVLMTSGLNGIVNIWDARDSTKPAACLQRGVGTPPWCMSATWDCHTGDKIYVGRRNACVEEYDLKMATSQPSRTLKLPTISGPVSCVQSLPNGRHILTASRDNIRLLDTTTPSQTTGSNTVSSSFFIVPGHHGGVISNLYVDPTCRYLVSTSGNRGWQGQSTDTVLIYDIDLE